MRPLFLTLPLLAASCATTPTDIRNLPPKAVLTSTKSEAALEECISERFAFLGGPAIVRGPSRTSLQFGSGGIVSLLVDLEGGNVIVRSGYPFGGKERPRLMACL